MSAQSIIIPCMKYLFLLTALVVLIVVVSFTLLNAQTVTINYYVNTAKIFLPVLLLLTVVFGVVVGFLVACPAIFRARHRVAKLRGENKQLSKEVDNLRNIPIEDRH